MELAGKASIDPSELEQLSARIDAVLAHAEGAGYRVEELQPVAAPQEPAASEAPTAAVEEDDAVSEAGTAADRQEDDPDEPRTPSR